MNPLPHPRTITIFRGYNCWLANVPDWNVQGLPLPFCAWVSALRVEEHLHHLHPTARIIFEEEAR